MAEFHIDEQTARLIQNADTIINHLRIPPRNHLAVGMKNLASHYYPAARESLGKALRDDSDNPQIRYYLALSMLDGQRPRRHSTRHVEEIRKHLDHAWNLDQARILRVLVDEDHDLHWRRRIGLPAALVELVKRLDVGLAEEITAHVPAPESRVWRALASRTTNQGTRS
jgi:hypothetical protein